MKAHYKHSFDRLLFGNRWLRPKYDKRGDWLVIGIYKKYFSPIEYEYLISFFGLECRIWMKREWIESISEKSESLKESDKINWFNSCLQIALIDLNAIECLDCGYVCKEQDLINKTGKNSKDEIVCCPKCESKGLKYY